MAAPVLKWCGGKTRLLPEILARLPRDFTPAQRYYEPFAGGAALFFRLESMGLVKRAVLGDVNKNLIGTYKAVRDSVDAVIACLRDHKRMHEAEGDAYYYRVRGLWNDPRVSWLPSQHAAAFIYLNKTCFNGLYRENSKGEFNVPAGKFKDPKILDEGALRAASRALASVELCAGSYTAANTADDGAFVYFDPPYDDTFTGYSAGGFGKDDQRKLARFVYDLVQQGVRVMLSNNDTPLVRELYGQWRIDTVRCARAINSDGAGRGEVNEVIVCAGYVPTGIAPPEREIHLATEARASHRG